MNSLDVIGIAKALKNAIKVGDKASIESILNLPEFSEVQNLLQDLNFQEHLKAPEGYEKTDSFTKQTDLTCAMGYGVPQAPSADFIEAQQELQKAIKAGNVAKMRSILDAHKPLEGQKRQWDDIINRTLYDDNLKKNLRSLDIAIMSGHVEAVQCLLDYGVDSQGCGIKPGTGFRIAKLMVKAKKESSKPLLDFEKFVDSENCDEELYSKASEYLIKGHGDKISALQALDLDLQEGRLNSDQFTTILELLFEICIFRISAARTILMDNGPTLLHYAVKQGSLKMLEVLASHPEIDLKNKLDSLEFAVKRGKDSVAILVQSICSSIKGTEVSTEDFKQILHIHEVIEKGEKIDDSLEKVSQVECRYLEQQSDKRNESLDLKPKTLGKLISNILSFFKATDVGSLAQAYESSDPFIPFTRPSDLIGQDKKIVEKSLEEEEKGSYRFLRALILPEVI